MDFPITAKAIVNHDLNQLLILSSSGKNKDKWQEDIKAYFYIIFFELYDDYFKWKRGRLGLSGERGPSVFLKEKGLI